MPICACVARLFQDVCYAGDLLKHSTARGKLQIGLQYRKEHGLMALTLKSWREE